MRGTTLSEEIKTGGCAIGGTPPAGEVRGTTLSEEIKTLGVGRHRWWGRCVRGTTLSEEIKTYFDFFDYHCFIEVRELR